MPCAGSNPGNTGYFVDGLRVPALFHFALGPAVIHPQFLDNLTFYPSAYPPGYGRYVGGVVAAETTNAPNDRFRGSVDVRLYDAAVTASTPFNEGKGTVSAAARYAYPGAMLSLLQEEVDLHYWDYQARVDHPLGPGRLSVLALGSYDSLTVTERACGGRSAREARSGLAAHSRDRGGQGEGRPHLPPGGPALAGADGRAAACWRRWAPATTAPPRPTTTTPTCRSAASSLLPRLVYDRRVRLARRRVGAAAAADRGRRRRADRLRRPGRQHRSRPAPWAPCAPAARSCWAPTPASPGGPANVSSPARACGSIPTGRAGRTPSTCSRACTCATASASSCG